MGISFQLRIGFAPGLTLLGEATGSLYLNQQSINLYALAQVEAARCQFLSCSLASPGFAGEKTQENSGDSTTAAVSRSRVSLSFRGLLGRFRD